MNGLDTPYDWYFVWEPKSFGRPVEIIEIFFRDPGKSRGGWRHKSRADYRSKFKCLHSRANLEGTVAKPWKSHAPVSRRSSGMNGNGHAAPPLRWSSVAIRAACIGSWARQRYGRRDDGTLYRRAVSACRCAGDLNLSAACGTHFLQSLRTAFKPSACRSARLQRFYAVSPVL